MSDRVQHAKVWLEQLLQLMQYPASVMPLEVEEELGNSAWLDIDANALSAEQIQHLIGAQGHTIDALQYLINAIMNLGVPPEEQKPFTLELNGYRQERQAQLRSLVTDVAKTVQTTGEPIELEAMSSAERRQVHNLFQEYSDIHTESRGTEPNRRLWVQLKIATTSEEA